MKSAFSTAFLASAFAMLSGSLGAASEGMLLCHVIGIDNTINNNYYVNGVGEAVRNYVDAHHLAYNLTSVSFTDGEAVPPQNYLGNIQMALSDARYEANNGRQKVSGGVGGAFIYDVDLAEKADGTAAGKYVRDLIIPDTVTCNLIQLDG